MSDEKTNMETLSGRVPAGIPDAFRSTVPAGYKVGHCLAAAARLWIDLPPETRLQILTGQIKEPLVDIVTKIVDERFEAGRAAGERLTSPRRKTPGQCESVGVQP
jgi:hypothetical protein